MKAQRTALTFGRKTALMKMQSSASPCGLSYQPLVAA
jgi:hypothetical protein